MGGRARVGVHLERAGPRPALTFLALALLGLAGGFLTSLVGFAFGLVVLPGLLLLGMPLPGAVFAVLLVGGLTRVPDFWRGRSLIDRGRLGRLLLGCFVGTLGGLGMVAAVPEGALRMCVGALCIGAVVLQAAGTTNHRTRKHRPSTSPAAVWRGGLMGGLVGPGTGLSGVPPSLTYLRAGVARANTIAELSGYFVVSNSVMLLLLSATSGPPPIAAAPLAVLVTASAIGTAVGTYFAPFIPRETFRRLTLLIALASGVGALISSL